MSVQSKLDTILSNCDDIREALVEKGVSSASTHGTSGFASDIRSIPSGGNGLVATYHINENGVAQDGPIGDLVFNGVVDIEAGVLVGAGGYGSIFKTKTNITSVSFPDLTNVSGTYALQGAFQECTNLSSIDFPQLSSVSGDTACYATFYYCTSLQTVSMPALIEATSFQGIGAMFGGCTSLKSARFENLTSVYGDEMFKGCTALSSVYLPELSSVNVSWGMFQDCTSLSSISLPKLKHADDGGMWRFFQGCTSLTEVHFGAANKEAIEALDIYDDKFGAPSTCVFYFDL